MQAGYFEFKKEKFVEMLRKHYESVRDFFAVDTNGDLVRDEGLSIRMNNTLQYIAATNYRAENGRVYPSIIENRIAVAQIYIKDRQKRTKSFEKQMATKRERFINQIRRAEQAEARSQSIRARLGAFGGQNSGGR
jgi:flagellar capping protein FliD